MHTHAEAPRPLTHRITATFIAPRRLLADFRAGTRWLDVLVISTAVAILSVYLLPEAFFVEQMRDAVTRRGDPVDITSSPAEIARWGRYLGMLTALVSHPLFALGLAGLLTLLFTVLGGATTSFHDHLSLTSHAFLIPAVGSLLALPLQYLTGNATAQFSPALFLTSTDSLPLLVISGLDLFTVWMLVVIAIWLGGLNENLSTIRAAAVLLGLYLTLNVITAALITSA
ncbi:hypothetical protein BH23GEM6_BH23GEM6_17900 [soil metagenome]